MGKMMILNGSPRAPKSNSKLYAQIFSEKCSFPTEYRNISKTNHLQLCEELEGYEQVLLVFPLYADGLPVTLLNFLKTWEEHPPKTRPTVSVLINCGFLEPHQNDVAVEMVKLFCKKVGFPFGSALKIGSGEAILSTPFRFFAVRKIRQLAKGMEKGQNLMLQVTMPISANMFLKASTKYWINYGKRNGITKEQMETMEIEGSPE